MPYAVLASTSEYSTQQSEHVDWSILKRNLPPGWTLTTLGRVTQPLQRRVNPQDHPDLPYIGMENVEPHTMRLLGTVPAGQMKSSADSFSIGDVLYGRLRPYLNKVLCPDFDGLCSTEFIVFRKVPYIYSRYLQYFLNSSKFVFFSNSLNAGDRPRVKYEQLADYPFPLPPLPEQERIVERIESLFTQLDAGVAGFKRCQETLKRYKASVLKAACEGKLVSQDPSNEPAQEILKRMGNTTLTGNNLPELPVGWSWAKFDQYTKNFDGKRIPVKASDRETMDGEYPYYGASGVIDYVNDYLFDGDYLLIAEDGANLFSRSTPIAFQAHSKFWVNNHAHVVRTLDDCPLSYLEYYLNSFDLRFYLTGTAQPKLTQANLNKIPIPIPPLLEQQRIIAEVERRLSVVQELEQTMEANLRRSGRLRQAILKQAFEGKLN